MARRFTAQGVTDPAQVTKGPAQPVPAHAVPGPQARLEACTLWPARGGPARQVWRVKRGMLPPEHDEGA